MLNVKRSDLSAAMRTAGWLNLQTGAVYCFHKWYGNDAERPYVPDPELEGDISQYIRLPRICPVQKRIFLLASRPIEERLLRKHGLENYLDLKRDEKLLYPTFYGALPLTAEDRSFCEKAMALLRDDDEAMLDPRMDPNEADTQYELDLDEKWAVAQGFNLVGSWKVDCDFPGNPLN